MSDNKKNLPVLVMGGVALLVIVIGSIVIFTNKAKTTDSTTDNIATGSSAEKETESSETTESVATESEPTDVTKSEATEETKSESEESTKSESAEDSSVPVESGRGVNIFGDEVTSDSNSANDAVSNSNGTSNNNNASNSNVNDNGANANDGINNNDVYYAPSGDDSLDEYNGDANGNGILDRYEGNDGAL
jgi:cytoskeletal protein RodZ